MSDFGDGGKLWVGRLGCFEDWGAVCVCCVLAFWGVFIGGSEDGGRELLKRMISRIR